MKHPTIPGVTTAAEVPKLAASIVRAATRSDPLSGGQQASHADEKHPEVTDHFAAHLIWLASAPLIPGRPYTLKTGAQSVSASVTTLKHRINVETREELACRQLIVNEVGFCNIATSGPIQFTPYDQAPERGTFILVDKLTGQVAGAGLFLFGLRRATNVQWQAMDISRKLRAEQKGQTSFCLWFTGLSGSGKSTIVNALDRRLFAMNRHASVLDGDNVRHGLNRDLGFTDADRVENIRRVAEVSKLMVDAGLITLVAFISPFRSERRLARDLYKSGQFLEVFVDTPLAVCEARDVKGLYRRARAGEIKNFTGIDSEYQTPEAPEIRLDTASGTIDALIDTIIADMQQRRLI